MEITQQYYKTRFNYFAPFDFETYKKIKKIKAVLNISGIQAIRYGKWARKLPKNRRTKKPIFCELFYIATSYMDYYINWDDEKGKYVETNVEIEFAKKTELNALIVDLWQYATAKPLETDIGPEPEFIKTIDIDQIYVECKEFYRSFIDHNMRDNIGL